VRAISEMRARGRYADVERLCRFCLRLDPLNEEATLALAESVALAGGKAEAVGLIDRYEGEVGRYRADLRVPASLLRERISDRLIRRSQASVELPMVGREQDVERVLSAFQRLRGNRAVSYVITGAAGVGKTRLATECGRMAELQGARLLTIGTQPSSRTQALFAVSELVDGLLQMPGAIGCAPAALECLRAMSSPMPIREPLSLDADGEARFAMVRWSILDVLDAVLSEGPLVIHIDDAHQLDAQSQAILQDGLRTHAARPLLVLFTMRPAESSDTERFSRLVAGSITHDLLPLTDVSCDLLVQRFCAVHEESLDDATRERIIQLSGGNPFFLVELLKHRSDLVSDDLPITVQALLEDRLGRLSPTALTVLRAAAVLGLSSSVERLHRMVERKTSEVLGALTELHAAGMLSSADDGAVCRHDTIREAVLERTPTAARVLLHRRAARALGREALREGGVALLWECVHHWRSAGATRNGVKLALVLA
jgi:predicted ATPase